MSTGVRAEVLQVNFHSSLGVFADEFALMNANHMQDITAGTQPNTATDSYRLLRLDIATANISNLTNMVTTNISFHTRPLYVLCFD